MIDGRIDEYLTGLDAEAAADALPYAPDFDEWNALQARMGLASGSFWEYLCSAFRYTTPSQWDALVYFGAIDDDDYVPQTGE